MPAAFQGTAVSRPRPYATQFPTSSAHILFGTTTQIIREVVEPLRESWQRKLAVFELARIIRERAFDIGVDADEVIPCSSVTIHRGLGTREMRGLDGIEWPCRSLYKGQEPHRTQNAHV